MASQPTERTRKRLIKVFIGAAALIAVLIGRLFYIQILDGERLQSLALSQWAREFTIAAKRGDITDRNGKVLAQSASAATIVAATKDIDQEKALESAQKLAETLSLDQEAIYKKITDTSKGQQVLARQIKLETAEEVRKLKIKGININEDTVRAYPMGAFLTQVLGFTDISGQGQEGLEKYLDKYLAGTNGRIVSEVDAKNRKMLSGTDEYIEPEDGYAVSLTVDYVMQAIVEKVCEEALVANEAKGVRCLMMDVQTGEILAMCNKPDFDLNEPPRDDLTQLAALMRNSCVADAYEPGSTFKILTTSLALEQGVATVDSTFNCKGYEMVDGDKIKCWRSGNPHGSQNLVQGVCNSCNPVFINLALRMGRDNFYSGLRSFGIGQEVNIDMPGASSGQMIAIKYVKNVDIARVAFGQSVSVSPVQLLTAASAAVNGGNLMKPHIVKEIVNSQGEVVESFAPEVMGNPISEETSATMRQILETAVTEGGGRNAYIPGFRVGGKTGTAQKYVNGKVSNDLHICSFLGFAPMDDPKIGLLFIVDEPGVRPDYGSTVAAPFARDILEDVLSYMGVPKVFKEDEEALAGKTTIVPDVVGKTIEEARAELTKAKLTLMVDGIGDKIAEQLPAGDAEVPQGSLVMLYTEDTSGQPQPESGLVEVPDVTGMSMIEANRTLRQYGLKMRISGSGLARSQSPEAGEMVDPADEQNNTVKVTFGSS